ncbi:MAG: glycerol-3-phosphate 1-O-acyltransferase PlsY [Lachnospiraceae bacterium]|nr:glycerol-3-phosphate 1-O-acyltransferase PlsY [Lachnospiraceae bacterium]
MNYQKILILLVGYLFGLIQTGYFYAKIMHVDLRSKGSGNTGTTNTLRVMGKKAGAIVFLGDFLKAFSPCMVMKFLIAKHLPDGDTDAMIYTFYIGLGVILGHNFPFFLKFKGGKGIACTGAVAIALDGWVALFGFTAFALLVFLTGYVSLSSLYSVTQTFVWIIIKQILGSYGLTKHGGIELIVLSVITALLAYYQHRKNIVRLLNGTENKFNTRKHKEAKQ